MTAENEKLVEAFIAGGGSITVIPPGVMAISQKDGLSWSKNPAAPAPPRAHYHV